MLIRLRAESKGSSATRGSAAQRAFFARPSFAAYSTRAHSVGSPSALPPAPGSASLQRASAFASSASGPKLCCTSMRFWVRVPVLSEQTTWAQPRVSTAVRRRMTAPWRLMRVTPMLSTMVTTAASPSGTAATARLTATMKLESTVARSVLPARHRSKPKMNTQMASTSALSERLRAASFNCRGVLPWDVAASTPAMRPISVSMPVAVTSSLPRPALTVLPM